jgi:(4S)-4-hydroxy-5-phosphonooxypentane-2,3-dione isomerase
MEHVVIVHTAHLTCKAHCIEAFQRRLRQHAKTTRELEAGCRKFDVHQSTDDPCLFFLHEIYEDAAALKKHQSSEHFRSFRADTEEWVVGRQWWFWKPSDLAN